jgi:hypothetical protein
VFRNSDRATGRLGGGGSHLNYAICHDRYQRTGDGWQFIERVYEIRYLDESPLAAQHTTQRRRPVTHRPGTRRRKDDGDHHPP